jgi:nucleoside-diphosphate-sugar epimerase
MTAIGGEQGDVRAAEMRVLLTGASGYVGGRLLPRLERRGLRVRCLARRPEFLADRVGPGAGTYPTHLTSI